MIFIQIATDLTNGIKDCEKKTDIGGVTSCHVSHSTQWQPEHVYQVVSL